MLLAICFTFTLFLSVFIIRIFFICVHFYLLCFVLRFLEWKPWASSSDFKRNRKVPLKGSNEEKENNSSFPSCAGWMWCLECEALIMTYLLLAIIKHSTHKTQEQSDPLPEDHTGHAFISLPPESLQDITSPTSLAGLFSSQLNSPASNSMSSANPA